MRLMSDWKRFRLESLSPWLISFIDSSEVEVGVFSVDGEGVGVGEAAWCSCCASAQPATSHPKIRTKNLDILIEILSFDEIQVFVAAAGLRPPDGAMGGVDGGS